MAKDYSEAPLTPKEVEAVKAGALVVRYNPNDPKGKVKAIFEGMALLLGTKLPNEEEIDRAFEEVKNKGQNQ